MKKEPIYILLADDDEDDRQIFIEAIRDIKMNTVVNTVKDGKELIDYLIRKDTVLPHVIFLDLNMPCKTGLDCLIEIKEMDQVKETAIAIYSTSSSEKDIEETFVKGANIYINKPDDFNILKKVLAEVITMNWQYQTSGLNRDNFLLSV